MAKARTQLADAGFQTALVDLASHRRFSYGELDQRVSRLASHLRDALKEIDKR